MHTDHDQIKGTEQLPNIKDVVVAMDGRVRAKEDEKVENYKYLAREDQLRMWEPRTKVIPVVLEELDNIP